MRTNKIHEPVSKPQPDTAPKKEEAFYIAPPIWELAVSQASEAQVNLAQWLEILIVEESKRQQALRPEPQPPAQEAPDPGLVIFAYGAQPVRTVMLDGTPWFVAADVAHVLGIKNVRQNLAEFPEDETRVSTTYTNAGPRKLTVINEPGLYRLVMQSRKPAAEAFKTWIFHEVLPSLRKTGTYTLTGAPDNQTIILRERMEALECALLDHQPVFNRLATIVESMATSHQALEEKLTATIHVFEEHSTMLTSLYQSLDGRLKRLEAIYGINRPAPANPAPQLGGGPHIQAITAHIRGTYLRSTAQAHITKIVQNCKCSYADAQAALHYFEQEQRV